MILNKYVGICTDETELMIGKIIGCFFNKYHMFHINLQFKYIALFIEPNVNGKYFKEKDDLNQFIK